MQQPIEADHMESDICSNRSQSQSSERSRWNVFGSKIPHKEVVFFSQIITLYTIIIACIINLSVQPTQQSELWVCMLSMAAGAILPNPKLKQGKTSKTLSLPKLDDTSNL